MVEATNFVEKTLGKSLDPEKNPEPTPEMKTPASAFTPPSQPIQQPVQQQPQTIQIIQQPPQTIQIVEKVTYKKERIHGFFRTLTIIALLIIGFLMLGESTGIIQLSINSFKLHLIFPIIIILSAIIIRSYKGIFGRILGLIIFLTVFGGLFGIEVYTGLNPSSKRKGGVDINYSLATTSTTSETNLYLNTLIANSYIEGNAKGLIKGTRNSDRNLLVSLGSTGTNQNISYINLNEDNNRNLLQNYLSTIDLTIPNNTIFDLIYIKNFLGLHTIDLNTFQRKMLKFHAGIDDITVKVGNVLPGNRIEIQGAAANVTFDIPKDIGVMMYYKHFIGMLKLQDFDALTGHYFQSTNFNSAKAILNIYVNLGIGNTKVNRVNPR